MAEKCGALTLILIQNRDHVQKGKKIFVQKMKLIIEIKKTFFNKLDVVVTREVADRQTA